MPSDTPDARRPDTTPPPRERHPCHMPDGAVCRFNLWGRCCHALNESGVCPLVIIELGRLRLEREDFERKVESTER